MTYHAPGSERQSKPGTTRGPGGGILSPRSSVVPSSQVATDAVTIVPGSKNEPGAGGSYLKARNMSLQMVDGAYDPTLLPALSPMKTAVSPMSYIDIRHVPKKFVEFGSPS